MKSDDKLVEKDAGWCLAKPGEVYAVFLFGGKETRLQLTAGNFSAQWFNPWNGDLIPGETITGPGEVALGKPKTNPERDWVAPVKLKAKK